jgi:uncharacterized protein YifE (UPF0438 family)
MDKSTVTCETVEEAQILAPWAEAFREVDSGEEGVKAWMCFESTADAELWDNQK